MPTVILLDVSLSMSRTVHVTDSEDEVARRQLAKQGIHAFLDHLAQKLKLEFVSLVIFSSLWEQVVGFTRDYDVIREALEKVDEFNKTCIETALRGVTSLCIEEWTSVTPCQVILVTDGNAGIGDGSLRKSLLIHSQNENSAAVLPAEEKFPLPFQFPGKLHIQCIAPPGDKALDRSLAQYQKLVELNDGRGRVFVPDGSLSTASVQQMFRDMAEEYFVPLHGTLACGNLKCGVQVFPAPCVYDRDHDFEHVTREPRRELNICGFLDISDVASPPYLSRHLVLPVAESEKNSENGEKDGKKEEEDECEESKAAAFTVLLHGSLKVETMVALTQIAEDWYGLLYSFADSKKKANLMLSLFTPGTDAISWLGSLDNLAPCSDFSDHPYEDNRSPFPVRPQDRRSYTQNCVVWIKQTGLQSDIQKILRNAKKIPEKQQHFYKELNRLRRAALSFGFHTLLEAVAQLLEREVQFLPGNAHPDAALQLSHAAAALRSPSALDFTDNITPLRTNFTG